ncbi:serine/threonine-protein kinase [Hypoxylon fuscum]|nr:serine/threonine-protein kinase [Hypoxylon fuscum]
MDDAPVSQPAETHGEHPTVASLQDLTIVEAWDPDTNSSKYITFYLVTADEVVYFGESSKNKRDLTLEEYSSALKLIPDNEIYPDVPKDVPLTLAPESLAEDAAYFKRPGLTSYESLKGTDFVPKALLDETLVMEQISKSPHANIVGYYGCRVRRGRITAIVLERLDKTLAQCALTPDIQDLDQDQFLKELESAVDHLHSLGLAHNDIKPENIMIKNGAPVLIDFGSCQPFGKPLQSLGTNGWCEEVFFTSEKKHDIYSLAKLRDWLHTELGGQGLTPVDAR